MADELNADGETFGGSRNGDGEAGKSGEIEPLRVAHSFTITVGRFPGAFTVAESWSGRDGRQDNVEVFHGFQDAGAFEIARGGFVDEFEHREGRAGARGLQIIQKNWAKL